MREIKSIVKTSIENKKVPEERLNVFIETAISNEILKSPVKTNTILPLHEKRDRFSWEGIEVWGYKFLWF